MPKLGLKVWSTNIHYIKPAKELFAKGVYDFVELYVVKGTSENDLHQWQETGFPFLLHAPHAYGGLNFSLEDAESNNRSIITEVNNFMVALKPEYIIFHPGILGSLEETIRQINMFKAEFPDIFRIAVIENKPKIGLKNEECVGASPEEIKKILDETGLELCLDIGHATCYAAWEGIDHMEVIDRFISMGPKIYHLSDGDINSQTDMHLHFGEGNYDLSSLIRKIPAQAFVSIETDKDSESDLDDFEKDINYFKDAQQTVRT